MRVQPLGADLRQLEAEAGYKSNCILTLKEYVLPEPECQTGPGNFLQRHTTIDHKLGAGYETGAFIT
jgi:hypothetical protein